MAKARRRPWDLLGAGLVAGIMVLVLIAWEAQRSEDFEVRAAVEAERPDGKVLPAQGARAGDRLSLVFEASRDLHLYVLRQDARGGQVLLFPPPGGRSRLAGGRSHRLPPPGEDGRAGWPVSGSADGAELLLIARLDPLAALEEVAAAAPGREPAATGLLRSAAGEDPVRTFFQELAVPPAKERAQGHWLRRVVLKSG
jgi:hypothetical protein